MRVLLTLAFLAIVLSACSSPKTSYYTLSGSPVSPAPVTSNQTRVMVGPVTLPEQLDQPLLVVQNSSNQVSVYEYHRWAGSLKGDVGRVIAANLASELGTPNVWNYSQSTQTQYDSQVLMDVQSCDSRLGEAGVLDVSKSGEVASNDVKNKVVVVGKNSAAENAASIAITNASPKTRNISGRSLVRELVSNTGFEALVAAQSRALAKVSLDIAKAIN